MISSSNTMKTIEPLVTIVTPSFNSIDTIQRAIDSVGRQTYKNLEHIVIDGGSTDGTGELLSKLDQSTGQWVSEPDNGIAHAFNKGIARASGEIVGILNSDDWLEPDAVESIIGCYLTSDSPDVIFGNLYFPELGKLQRGDSAFSKTIRHYMPTINHPTCFVARRAYHKYGFFDDRLQIAMDFELMRRFFLKGATFCYLDKTISNMSLGGVSNRQLFRRYREMMAITGYHPITAAMSMRSLAGILFRHLAGPA